MRNIGPKSAAWLAAVEVRSINDLREVGVVETFARVSRQRLLQQPFKVSLNLLWALEGAISDCDCRDLTPARKAELKAELNALLNC